jgi:hypothetical protein
MVKLKADNREFYPSAHLTAIIEVLSSYRLVFGDSHFTQALQPQLSANVSSAAPPPATPSAAATAKPEHAVAPVASPLGSVAPVALSFLSPAPSAVPDPLAPSVSSEVVASRGPEAKQKDEEKLPESEEAGKGGDEPDGDAKVGQEHGDSKEEEEEEEEEEQEEEKQEEEEEEKQEEEEQEEDEITPDEEMLRDMGFDLLLVRYAMHKIGNAERACDALLNGLSMPSGWQPPGKRQPKPAKKPNPFSSSSSSSSSSGSSISIEDPASNKEVVEEPGDKQEREEEPLDAEEAEDVDEETRMAIALSCRLSDSPASAELPSLGSVFPLSFPEAPVLANSSSSISDSLFSPIPNTPPAMQRQGVPSAVPSSAITPAPSIRPVYPPSSIALAPAPALASAPLETPAAKPVTALAVPAPPAPVAPVAPVTIPEFFENYCFMASFLHHICLGLDTLPTPARRLWNWSDEQWRQAQGEHRLFSGSMDADLVALLNAIADSPSSAAPLAECKSELGMAALLSAHRELRVGMASIAGIDDAVLCRRLCVLREWNACLSRAHSEVLVLVDLARADSGDVTSLGFRLSSCRALIQLTVKTEFINHVLERTVNNQAGDHAQVTIDRYAAATAPQLERRSDHIKGSQLGQVYRQLKSVPVASLLQPRPSGSDAFVAFKVKFRNENAQGDEGPYSELFSGITRELQPQLDDGGAASSALPFFLPCPNNQTGVGEQRDKIIPRPSTDSQQDCAMFAFLGRLIGLAIRTDTLMVMRFLSSIYFIYSIYSSIYSISSIFFYLSISFI